MIMMAWTFQRFVKSSNGILGTTVSASSFSYYTTISRRDIITHIKNINIRRLAFSSTTANTTTTKRSFRILGVQQLAIGGLDKAALTSFWVDTLGITKTGEYKSERENVDEDILQLGSGVNAVEIDLMQPIDPSKAPKVHIPALNHIGLWVDDLTQAVRELTGKGVQFTPGGIRKGASGHDVAFVHPRSATGVLLELVQAPADVIAHHKQ